MARQDIRAGKAFVELTLKNSAFLRGLRTSGQRLKNFGGGMMRIGAGITAMGAAITAPLIAAAKHFASTGDQLDKMSNRTGVSVEALSELKFAAEQTGANVDILEKGFAGLSRTFFEAKRGAAVAVDALAELGLTFQDLDGLSPDQQLELIADGLTRISNESIRGAVAQKIFGRAGRQLLPLLKGAKGGIRELREEARRLGLTIGTEDATAAARLTDAMNRMRRVVTTTFFNIGAAIGGKLADGLDVIQGYVSGISKWVKANREIFVTVIKVGGAIVAAGIAVTSLGLAIKLAGFALSGFATALAVVKGLLLFIVSPIGLITAALGAGIVLWAKYTESGQRAVGAISNVMRQIFQTVSTTFGVIKDAISGGDLALAGRIAMAGLRVVFLHGLSAISSIFGNFTARFAKMLFSGDFAGAWDLAIKGMAKLWHEFAEGVVAVFTGAARLAVEDRRRSLNGIAG